jgi:hypothetical protein
MPPVLLIVVPEGVMFLRGNLVLCNACAPPFNCGRFLDVAMAAATLEAWSPVELLLVPSCIEPPSSSVASGSRTDGVLAGCTYAAD